MRYTEEYLKELGNELSKGPISQYTSDLYRELLTYVIKPLTNSIAVNTEEKRRNYLEDAYVNILAMIYNKGYTFIDPGKIWYPTSNYAEAILYIIDCLPIHVVDEPSNNEIIVELSEALEVLDSILLGFDIGASDRSICNAVERNSRR